MPETETTVESAPHSLKKRLKVLDIWALGVGVTITGEYVGWNFGLEGNNPIAVLIATLIVCLLYLIWVLALSELSVAMPFAGGPLYYGRRAVNPTLGFIMGWSMFLECLFATIAAAIATGAYVAFLCNPAHPSQMIEIGAALGTVAIFFVLHCLGVKEQSLAMIVMTYGAIFGLVIFWIAAAGIFSMERIWTSPILPEAKGWKSVLDAVPYALWWLLIIETVALAAEEAEEPSRTIPRGLVWAQLTLILLVGLTWLLACGAMPDAQQLAKNEDGTLVAYPLAKVVAASSLGKSPVVVYGFGGIALFGLIAGYHGMLFGTSRQLYTLGRDGYLPAFLGKLHPERRTPIAALSCSSVITAGFVLATLWFKAAIEMAVLISTLTALVWYILSMGCLIVLRKREPELFQDFRAPLYHILPFAVILLSGFAAYVYGGLNLKVIPWTVGLYAIALGYFWIAGRTRVAGQEQNGVGQQKITEGEVRAALIPQWYDRVLERLAELSLIGSLGAVGWMMVVSRNPGWGRLSSPELEVVLIAGLLLGALLLVSVVALRHTRRG